MEHIYYLNEKDKEYDNLINGAKKMLCFGVDWKKKPYNHIFIGDEILFVNNNKKVLLKSEVIKVKYFNKLSRKEKNSIINEKNNELMLTKKEFRRLNRRSFLIFVTISDVKKLNLI